MSENKVLTREIAEKIVNQAIKEKNEAFAKKYFGSKLGTFEITGFSSMTEEAAAEVAKFDGYGVKFIGLKCINLPTVINLCRLRNCFEEPPVLQFKDIIYIQLAALAELTLAQGLKVKINGAELKLLSLETIYKSLLGKVKKFPRDPAIIVIMETEISILNEEIDNFKNEIAIIKKWKNKLKKLVNS